MYYKGAAIWALSRGREASTLSGAAPSIPLRSSTYSSGRSTCPSLDGGALGWSGASSWWSWRGLLWGLWLGQGVGVG